MNATQFLQTTRHYYTRYRELAEKAMAQLEESQLFLKPFEGDSDIAIIVQHIAGNLNSRWTDFLTADGEKEWRHRDREFEPVHQSRAALMKAWDEAWEVVFQELSTLTEENMDQTITIRSEPLSVQFALMRNLNHTAYHVGQIVFLAKSIKGEAWQSLSVPKGKSEDFNREMKHK